MDFCNLLFSSKSHDATFTELIALMKNAIRITAAILVLAAASWAGVTVTSPLPASVSRSPVHFVASAESSSPMTAMRIYVDGSLISSNSGGALDVSVPLTAGTHIVVVRAWDSEGAVFQSDQTVTVDDGIAVSSPVEGSSVALGLQTSKSASPSVAASSTTVVPDNRIVIPAAGVAPGVIVIASGKSATPPKAAAGLSPSPRRMPFTPAVPAGTVIDRIEEVAWLTCGSCGNDGGTGTTATYFDTRGIATPSEDGSSTRFSIAATVPFTNGYFYQVHTPIAVPIAALTYEFDLYIPAGSETLPQAFEFECQQILSGWVYNFAWQAPWHSATWRTFDYGLKRWDASTIPFTHFTPGTWHHIVAEYHNDTVAHTVIHDALTVDGTRYPANITHNAFFSGAANNQFTNAVQLDSNSTATPYSVYIDSMRITYR